MFWHNECAEAVKGTSSVHSPSTVVHRLRSLTTLWLTNLASSCGIIEVAQEKEKQLKQDLEWMLTKSMYEYDYEMNKFHQLDGQEDLNINQNMRPPWFGKAVTLYFEIPV